MKSTISNPNSLNLLPVALVLFDNKKVYFVNKRAHLLLCLPIKADLNKLNPLDFIHPDFQKRIKNNNTQILNGKEFGPVELKVKNTKGKYFFIEAKSNAVFFNGRKVVQSVFYEISERKNYYDLLENSSEILNLLGQNSSDILFKYDYLPSERFSYISQSFKKITGYEPSDIIKNSNAYKKLLFNDIKYTQPSNQKKFIKKYNEEGRVITPIKTKQSKTVWIESTINIIRNNKQKIVSVIGIGRDVTQQKETELQLNDAQNQLHLIAKNAHDVIYFFTYQPKPKYLFISDSVERVLGYKPENFYKDPLFINKRSIGKTNDFKKHEKIAAIEQKNGKLKQKKILYQVKNNAGVNVWMEDHVNPVYDEKGKISFLFGIVRNVDELKRKEGELNQKWSDYKILLDQSPIAFYIHSNGVCLMCNKAAVDLVKAKSEKNIIGKSILKYIVKEQRPAAIERMKLATKGKEWDFKSYQIVNKKGTKINVEIKTVPITYNGTSCVLSLVKDISERELVEKNKLKAELAEESNRGLKSEIKLREDAEKQLTEQKNKLSAIFENSQHVVWTINKNRELTYFNKNFEKLFFDKHGKKTTIGKRGDLFVSKQNTKAYNDFWEPYYKRAFNGEQLVFELKDYTSKGVEIFREVYINPIYNNNGDVTEISCMANDVSETKKAEKQLLEQSARIKTIFDNGDQTIWTVDSNFKYTTFNKNFINAFKSTYNALPILHKTYSDCAKNHPEVKSIAGFWDTKYKEVLKGNPIEFVVERKHLSGEKVIRRFYLQPIFDANNKVVEISGLGKEITEEIYTQQKILNQAAKLNSIFEGSSHYVWTVDVNNNLTAFNKNYIELIKSVYNTTPVFGKPINREKKTGDISYIKQMALNYKKAFSGEKVNFELKLEGFNKKEIYLNVFLNPIFDGKNIVEVSGIAHDVTDRFIAIENLKSSEEKGRAIINAIPDLLFTMDIEGRFLDYKAEDAESLFVKPAEFIGKTVTEVFPGFLGEEFKEKIVLSIKTNTHQNYNYSFEHFGSINYYEARYRKINDTECLVLIRDVSFQKRGEEKLTQSLKEKEVLLKEVHHRVKNNMQIISSILNLQSSYTTDEYILNLLRESQNRIKTMAYIHESLYQNKTFSSINFNDYLGQLTNNVIHSHSVNSQQISLNINCAKIILNLDVSIPLGLIINELVTNAIKHAFPGGKKGFISINLATQNNFVLLTVEDNGVGVQQDLKPENSGTLGLQLVYTLVDQIDGKINFERLKPNGTKVTISILM